MTATLTLNRNLSATLSATSEDEAYTRQCLVAARKRTHSVQEAERLDIALKQACGVRHDAEDFGMRHRLYASLCREGQVSAKPAGVAQWHIGLKEVLTCEGVFLKAEIALEAFWCEPLAEEAGLATELAAEMAERIAAEVASHTAELSREYEDVVTLWTLESAPAALHAAGVLKTEVGVALMNELYGKAAPVAPCAAAA